MGNIRPLMNQSNCKIYVFGSLQPFNNKQLLLNEAERDIKNCLDRGQCYLPKPKAEADNIDLDLDNS